MGRYLIVVSRDRPDVFQELSERHGHEFRVILDRRLAPRLPVRMAGQFAPHVRCTGLEDEGFMIVPEKGHGLLAPRAVHDRR